MGRTAYLLLATAVAALASTASALKAEGVAACPGTANSVCVQQVGDRNTSNVDLQGGRNGSGSLGGEASGALSVLSGVIPGISMAAPIAVPLMTSGTVSQQGDDNRADVLVRGDDNQYSVSQQGDRNSATQLALGNRNAVASVQTGSDNRVGQLVVGADNKNYISQFGPNNVATSQQVPSAELALLSGPSSSISGGLIAALASGALGAANSNTVLLEQNNGNNLADLLQVGSGHSIALRQDGNASISILQTGTGKSISVEQTAGSQGIQITQH